MPTTKRKALSKKIRFEVFKRDSFKCQYCGKSAPDVILHVDHIDPVSRGGKNDLINLITSCQPCNAGKGARTLGDDSAVSRQKAQLDEMNERCEQLKLMLKWRDTMGSIEETSIAALSDHLCKAIGFSLSDSGKRTAKGWLKKYPLDLLFDAIDKSVEVYATYGASGEVTRDGASEVITKVPGVAKMLSLPPDAREIQYIKGILRSRFGDRYAVRATPALRSARERGAPVTDLKELARAATSQTDFANAMESRYGECF